MAEVLLYEFNNNSTRNRVLIKAFIVNRYPEHTLSYFWDDEQTVFLVLMLSSSIIGAAVFTPYDHGHKVHIRVIFILEDWRNKGLGTGILKHAAKMYRDVEVTLSVTFGEAHVLGFYYLRGYARLKAVSIDLGVYVLSLLHDNLLP